MQDAAHVSELKVYSLGIVAENKKLDSKVVEVTPVERIPMLDGEIKSDVNNETISSQDSQGGTTQVTSSTANSFPATWLPLGSSNRFTAPDVRRGERVVLYRFSNSDEYFWTTLHDDIHLRKLETVIYVWSATQDENAPVDSKNYYFFEVSTHKGLIHLHTSKANGEFCSYDLQINTKDGVIRIQDDVGNLIVFDSKEKQIAAQNADQCSFEINKKNMTLIVPETYTLQAKNKIEQIGETVKINAGNSIAETTKAFTVNASDSLKEAVGSYDLNSNGSVNVEASGSISASASTINQTASGPIAITGAGVKISHGVQLS